MPRGSVRKYTGPRGTSWRVTIDIGKHPDGSRHQIRRAFATRRAADDFLSDTLVKVRTKTFVEPSTELLGAYLKRWTDAAALRGVKESSLNSYDTIAAQRWGPLAHVRLCDLTTAAIEARMAEELAAGLAPTTIRTGIIVLRAALEDAVERGELPSNPAKLAPTPTIGRRPVKAWTVEEADRVMAVIRADPLWAWQETLVYVLLETGCRIGEMLVLTWEDVDWDDGKVKVRRTQTCTRAGRLAVGPAKRDSSLRDVKLSAPALAALKTHRVRVKEIGLREGPGFNRSGLVFPSVRGIMQARNRVAEMLKAASRRAGVLVLTTHGLRHSSASIAIRNGVPIKVVSERLGHSAVATTLGIYVHTSSDDHAKAADVLGEAFGRKAAGG